MTPRDAEFVAKTRAELARLVGISAKVRERRPAHRWCPDNGACRPCAAIRDAHRLIDDHLDQLEAFALDALLAL